MIDRMTKLNEGARQHGVFLHKGKFCSPNCVTGTKAVVQALPALSGTLFFKL